MRTPSSSDTPSRQAPRRSRGRLRRGFAGNAGSVRQFKPTNHVPHGGAPVPNPDGSADGGSAQRRHASRPIKHHPWLTWLIWTLVGPVALLIVAWGIFEWGTVLMATSVTSSGLTDAAGGLSGFSEIYSSPGASLVVIVPLFLVTSAPLLGFCCLIGTIVSAVKNNHAYQVAMRDYAEGWDVSWYDVSLLDERRPR